MRHRITAVHTGLGNPSPELMDNQWSEDERFNQLLQSVLSQAIDLYFTEKGGVDFKISEEGVLFGYEPAYQYERLKLIFIGKDKDLSYISTGKAWGGYGSNVVINKKYYREYLRQSKFVKCIDRWHQLLFSTEEQKG